MMRKSLIAVLIGVGVLAACRREEPEQPVPVTTPTPVASDTAGQGAARARADSIARENERRAEEARRSSAAVEVRNALMEMVFFDYDRAEIRGDMQDVLSRKAAALRSNPNVSLRIDGHADERGSVEYNLALSLRRANAVREYLAGAGLDAGRFEVAAFGEERPLESGQSEDAYARNRRAEFQITRGGDNLNPIR
jgi:peptidoglycan-associated lipoprotein